MAFETRLQLIKYLNSLIARKFTGSSTEYARKLNISNTTSFRLLNHIREQYGVGINHNTFESCYEYERPCHLYLGFIYEKITKTPHIN